MDANWTLPDAMIRRNEKYTTSHFEGIKWCEDYEEYQFVENFLSELPHYFIRIGGNYDDVEVRYRVDGYHDMLACINVVRRVYTDTAGDCVDFADIA